MDKDKNKGLADNQEGEFVLNESGTSVSIDPDLDFSEEEEPGAEGQTEEVEGEEIRTANDE